MIVWINGPFGVGKSTTAAPLAQRWADATVFDPEHLGHVLRRWQPAGEVVDDFQHLSVWRRLVSETATGLIRDFGRPLIVPMTLLNPQYFDEIVGGLRADGLDVQHFCLVADRDEVLRRVRQRGDQATAWIERKYDEYASTILGARFDVHLDAVTMDAEALTARIAACLPEPSAGHA